MADGIYIGMSAAAARAAQLDAVADNLANAETPGFKATRPAFASFVAAHQGPLTSDKVAAGLVGTGVDLRPGMPAPTGNPLDVVPQGDLFLGVQLDSGQMALTRNGRIQVGPDGELLVAGQPLLGRSGGPITIPEGVTPTIRENGDVIVEGKPIDTIGFFTVQGQVERIGQSLLVPTAGTVVDPVADGEVRVGEIELGNAPVLESTIEMIAAQRHFDTAMQAIQTYRRLDDRAIEAGRVR